MMRNRNETTSKELLHQVWNTFIEVFKNAEDGEIYALADKNNSPVLIHVPSPELRRYIRLLHYEETGTVLQASVLNTVADTVEMIAFENAEPATLYVRVAHSSDMA